jgi:hypothetical protein
MRHLTESMFRNPKLRFILLTAIAFCIPLDAQADAIIPYMVVPWGQAFLLPLVILVEATILRSLAGGKMLSCFFQSLIANIISTALGAALYLATMPLISEPLFYWWFKGGFASEAVRNACIALGFALVLWAISWSSETAIISRMRKTNFWGIARACAWANLVTYIFLLGLALWFQR